MVGRGIYFGSAAAAETDRIVAVRSGETKHRLKPIAESLGRA